MSGQRNYCGKRAHTPGDYIDNGGGKRRDTGEEKEPIAPGPDDSVFRYLCKVKQIGSIIGKGGENVKQLRVDTHAIIRIGESVRGCDERVVAIFSTSKETNSYGDTNVCPAQDALLRIHVMLTSDEIMDENSDMSGLVVTARLLVPTDQIGCLIGKGGHIIQGLRTDTGAQIRILTDLLPACAMSGDELLVVSGQPPVVKKALLLLTSRLRDNPSRSNHLLTSNVPSIYSSGSRYDPPMVVVGPPVNRSYGGGYRSDREWMPYHLSRRDRMPAIDFSLRLLCPSAYVGGVIGKAGSVIKQIRQDSGANIMVDSVEDDCIITISAKEHPDDPISQSIDAAVRLQPRCSERIDNELGELLTTRMLVPTSQIGCLIGKGGTIISDMRRVTRADIRILSKEHLPKVASEDDEMVQISGGINIAREALIQVTTRLKSNIFESEGALSRTSVPCAPNLNHYERQYSSWRKDRDNQPDRHGSSYSRGYDRGTQHSERHGRYGGSQSGGSTYGGGYSGRSGSAGFAGPNHSYEKHNGY